MTPSEKLESLFGVAEELRRSLHILQDLTDRGADAGSTNQAVQGCVNIFLQMTALLRSLEPVHLHHEQRQRLRDLHTNLSSSYVDCLEKLAMGTARVVSQLAAIQKKESVSGQYKKIAALH